MHTYLVSTAYFIKSWDPILDIPVHCYSHKILTLGLLHQPSNIIFRLLKISWFYCCCCFIRKWKFFMYLIPQLIFTTTRVRHSIFLQLLLLSLHCWLQQLTDSRLYLICLLFESHLALECLLNCMGLSSRLYLWPSVRWWTSVVSMNMNNLRICCLLESDFCFESVSCMSLYILKPHLFGSSFSVKIQFFGNFAHIMSVFMIW